MSRWFGVLVPLPPPLSRQSPRAHQASCVQASGNLQCSSTVRGEQDRSLSWSGASLSPVSPADNSTPVSTSSSTRPHTGDRQRCARDKLHIRDPFFDIPVEGQYFNHRSHVLHPTTIRSTLLGQVLQV